ncbi:uncharacterized protein TNCT_164831 [Trichonephila clavata]|uniref:Uncharacterized protein n=1 Tax=Trichonephila clavata TaxID=2740835 RepID=A0A8X6GIA2_TRICU|nr:uncharacterized protein TNCT_164831 [Trichonephila clavata]
MNRSMMIALLVGLVLCAVVIEQAEAGGGLRWARLAKLALIARALKGKKIFLPLPLPLPIPLFKENIHHEPVPPLQSNLSKPSLSISIWYGQTRNRLDFNVEKK